MHLSQSHSTVNISRKAIHGHEGISSWSYFKNTLLKFCEIVLSSSVQKVHDRLLPRLYIAEYDTLTALNPLTDWGHSSISLILDR